MNVNGNIFKMNSLSILITGIIFLLSVFSSVSQNANLVPNGSFEIKKSCPIFYSQFNLLENWFKPVLGTSPDYFHKCWQGIPQNMGSVPLNVFGYQQPVNGDAYAGIGLDIQYQYLGLKNYREFISVKLNEDLKPCVKYSLSFYISLSDSANFKTSFISTLFTKDSIRLYLNDSMFLYQPQLNFNILDADTQYWYKVEGIYLAEGGEKFLTIGSFLDSNKIISYRINNNRDYHDGAYCYIDDVSLTEFPNQELNIPNIITPNSDGLNDYFVINNLPENHELRVYNRWGNQVYHNANYQNEWSPPDISTGVYFYILSPPCGEPYKGTVTVVREK